MSDGSGIVAGGGEVDLCTRCGARPGRKDRGLREQVNFDKKVREWTCPDCGHLNVMDPEDRYKHERLY